MKKTLFITMLAAALMGGQVFAEEAIPTTATNITFTGGDVYAGAYSTTEDVTGGDVTIQEDRDHGADLSKIEVYGGYTSTTGKTATYNTVTMTGGQVHYAVGAESSNGNATNNTATISGGQVDSVEGGESGVNVENNTAIVTGGQIRTVAVGGRANDNGSATGNTATISGGHVSAAVGAISMDGNTSNNTVIVSGGQVGMALGGTATGDGNVVGNNAYLTGGEVEDVYGGMADSGAATNNRVHLVGAGASVTVGGATFAGQAMQVGAVCAAMAEGAMTGNSIEIYGTGIAAATLGGMQMVNFHIVDGVLLSQDAMVSLTSTSEGLDLTGVELGFNAADVQDWGAYEGQSITLVTAAQAITIDQGSLGDVEIKGADGAVLATAQLALGNEGKSMVLSNIKGASPVPEPATGTLSLLALVGLCARRRRK